MSQELDTKTLVKLVEAEKLTGFRRRGQEALYRSLLLGAFGVLGYGMCWGYSLISNVTNDLREMAEDVVVGQPVHPTVFSEEGYAELLAYYKGKASWMYSAGRFNMDWRKAKMLYDRDGTVKALPWAADLVERWEKILIKRAVIPQEEAVATAPGGTHVVDKMTGWVLNNKDTYFGVVMAGMAVQAIPLVGEVVKGVVSKDG